MGEFNIITYLGNNSYPAILKNINESLMGAKCSTLVGDQLVSECYQKLNESKTPMLELKEFVTKAEKIAGDDVKLKEIIDFCRKSFKGGDYNFLINLCKEEHFAELSRTGHPSPEQTISAFEKMLNEPSSVIQQGIVNGMFDSMKSELLKNVKSELIQKKDDNLNESSTMLKGSLIKYSPIGIKLEDMKNNRVVFLLESDVLTFDHKTNHYHNLNESEIKELRIPEDYSRMMTAINSLAFNPENDTFSLNESWDFKLSMDKNGSITVNGKNIPSSEVRQLLLESVQIYTVNPEKTNGKFNRLNYIKDADNFLMLMENQKSLIKFSNLETIKNLNENTYILFDKDGVHNLSEPRILSSTKGEKLFESYQEMVTGCQDILNESISELFTPQLNHETQLINERNNKIVSLNESQKVLNQKISEISNLKNMAEENSPAMVKLNEQEEKLNKLLDQNISEMNHYKNEWKLYN